MITWIASEDDCLAWAGRSVSYPINLACLGQEIYWDRGESWVRTQAGELTAFGQILPRGANRHLSRLIVSPRHRGHGVGRCLAQHLLNKARLGRPAAVSLNVAAKNHVAIQLYQSLGFITVPRTRGESVSSSIYMEQTA